MVVLEIRVMRTNKERAAQDVAAILNALKEDDDSVRIRQSDDKNAKRGLRLAYSAE